MNLATIEAVVRRAFADEAFRRALVADPAGTLAAFDLTDTERRALTTALATPGGTVVAGWWPGFWWI